VWLPWILVPDSAPEKNPGVPLTANGFDGIFKVSPVSDRHGQGIVGREARSLGGLLAAGTRLPSNWRAAAFV